MKLMPVLHSLLHRKADTHKGDYGHVLVIAGSVGMTGAPALCAQAALRAGAGLVTLGVPDSVYVVVASVLMEVMVHPFPDNSAGTLSVDSMPKIQALLSKADVLAIGPGLSRNPGTVKVVRRLMETARVPVVLDADGIHAFAGSARKLLSRSKRTVIITPHPGEMADLLGSTTESVQKNRLEVARRTARECKVIVVLKGHRTVVASPSGKVVVNTTGNPGMATAGMGDLLTGIVAAFIGQGIDPFIAAQAGVYLHGLAGDLAARRVGEASMIASDVLVELPHAFKKAAGQR